MKPRITRFFGATRCYSQDTYMRALRAEKFALAVTGRPSKDLIIDTLRNHVKTKPTQGSQLKIPTGSDEGAVILTSLDFASWLEDEDFMSNLLKSLYSGSGRDERCAIDVLAGVTDGLGPGTLLGKPRRGFSVLYGSHDLLPDLFESAHPKRHPDRASSIMFAPSRDGSLCGPETTLPLANTVFQNGRRSTLFATRWARPEAGSSSALVPRLRRDKGHQTIAFPYLETLQALPTIPLLPLTPPRKIVAGLGNIVRQVEVDGNASPASRELETLIPQLFEARTQRDPNSSHGPVGVWALIIPAHAIEYAKAVFSNLRVFQDHQGEEEAMLSSEASKALESLISRGCRLHKILSGGGGWGIKQGLLSLDPETSYSTQDQDDVELFIKAFQERENEHQSEGLVTPGSYMLFCAEPAWTTNDIEGSPELGEGLILGVADKNDQDTLRKEEGTKVKVLPNHFSAVSSTGLYLKMGANPTSSGRFNKEISFDTKIDVPRSAFYLDR
ncbi:hypothetical protein BJ170DRAFT_685019 [Xylariales sp. AK1849]|nr:hypothetical protein BJ170DRAFT_685019 [Xylariales sp. AK1849]